MRRLLLGSAVAVLVPVMAVGAVVMLVPEWRVLALATLRGERFFEGRPTSAWAEELKSNWPRSGEALQKAGAVPVLVQALKEPEAVVRGRAARVLGRVGSTDAIPALVEAQQDKEPVVRCLAAYALAVMEPEGRQFSIRALLDHWSLKEPEGDFRAVIRKAVDSCPVEPLLDGLTKALKSDSVWVRAQAIIFLEQVGKPAVPALLTALRDRGKDDDGTTLGERAAAALERIDRETVQATVAELIVVLKDPGQTLADRHNAAYALGRFHAAAGSAVPALKEAVRDPNPAIKAEALNALNLIDKDPAAKAGALDF